jgi:sialic acid synthase SpsE
VLARGDLTTKRPGIFISPHHIDAIIGRSLASDVDPNVPLMPEDIAPRQRT